MNKFRLRHFICPIDFDFFGQFRSSSLASATVEAAAPFWWERYVGFDGAIIGVANFGASAPGPIAVR